MDVEKNRRKVGQTQIFDPFLEKGFLPSLQDRVHQGYFGPLASFDRSLTIETNIQSSIDNIQAKKRKWKETLSGNNEEKTKNEEVKKLKSEWQQQTKKGGPEELQWVEDAISLTAAYFELTKQKELNLLNFELRDNQIAQIELTLLNQGRYPFTELLTDSRQVGLPTGEGKTFTSGLAAAVMVLQGEKVHILEPNYISAVSHVRDDMGSFFENFLGIQAGVVIDIPIKADFVIKKVGEKGLMNQVEQAGKRKSYVFKEGKFIEISGRSDRNKSWNSQIVYLDPNSLGFDYLEDQQIMGNNAPYQPDLSQINLLVAEADSTLIDEAKNPWIISENITGNKAWENISDFCGITKILPKDWSLEEKIGKTQEIIFGLWQSLLTNRDSFIEGEGHDYLFVDNKLLLSPGISNQTIEILTQTMSEIFGSKKNAHQWLIKNDFIIDAALNVLLGMKPGLQFLTGEKGVLLDEFGFPLENRKLPLIHQVFLYLNSNWNDWWIEASKKKPGANPEDILLELINDNVKKVELSQETERILPISLYKKYKRIRGSSGSLIPASESFADLYQAETLAVSRHALLDMAVEKRKTLRSNSFFTKCLDDGKAEVELYEKKGQVDFEIISRAAELRKTHRAGVFIVPDIERAKKLANIIPNSTLVTAEEELKSRGSLQKATANMEPGKIVITTWMAHRDIDLKLNEDLIKKGGPEVLVVGLLPTERGLWQALQRAWRGDIPGSRRLMLSKEDLSGVINRHLFYGASPLLLVSRKRLHQNYKTGLEENWQKAVNGNFEAQTKVFNAVLSYLKDEEKSRKEELLLLSIRDGKLDDIKELFINKTTKKDKRSKLRKDELGQKAIAEMIDLIAKSKQRNWESVMKNVYGLSFTSFDTALKYLSSRIKQQELQQLWGSFLGEIEVRFYDFLSVPENQSLYANQNFDHLAVRWNEYIKTFI